MAKRKSANSKMASRKKPAVKLDKIFCCPFCNHAGSVDCEIDRKEWFAVVKCFVCKESYSTKAHALTEPIDVYSEWIDECEKANQGVDVRRRPGTPTREDDDVRVKDSPRTSVPW
jgi:transcription elongation factor Elf1